MDDTQVIEVAVEEEEPATCLTIVPHNDETPMQAVNRAVTMRDAIDDLINRVFAEDVHYGIVPNTKKPTLYQAGAEVVLTLMGLAPKYNLVHVTRDHTPDAPYFAYEVECELVQTASSTVVARGNGVCNSREPNYWRDRLLTCPTCGAENIRRSKPRSNDPPDAELGWYCWEKTGGCGANFPYNTESITSQPPPGKINDPMVVFDSVNSIRKMADKRALVQAAKSIAMLSARFTVDMEDHAPATQQSNQPAQPAPDQNAIPDEVPSTGQALNQFVIPFVKKVICVKEGKADGYWFTGRWKKMMEEKIFEGLTNPNEAIDSAICYLAKRAGLTRADIKTRLKAKQIDMDHIKTKTGWRDAWNVVREEIESGIAEAKKKPAPETAKIPEGEPPF